MLTTSRFSLIFSAFFLSLLLGFTACNQGDSIDSGFETTENTFKSEPTPTGCAATPDHKLCLLVPVEASGDFISVFGRIEGVLRHQYDGAGNIIKSTLLNPHYPDTPKLVFETEYDEEGKRVSEIRSFDHNLDGIFERTDTSVRIDYSPNLVEEEFESLSAFGNVTIKYSNLYNGDQLTSINYTEKPSGWVSPALHKNFNFSYDVDNRLTRHSIMTMVSHPPKGFGTDTTNYETFNFGYDPKGHLETVVYTNQDCLKDPSCIMSPSPAFTIQKTTLELGYDGSGNLTTMVAKTDYNLSDLNPWDDRSECQLSYLEDGARVMKFPEALEKIFPTSSLAPTKISCSDNHGTKTTLDFTWEPLWKAAGLEEPSSNIALVE